MTRFFFDFSKLRLKTVSQLLVHGLGCSLLLNEQAALNIQNFCHELRFGLRQIKSLFREFKAVVFVIVTQLSQCEVNLLERVSVWVVKDRLFDLFELTKELDENLLTALLACKFVLLLQILALLFDDLLELRHNFST